MKNNEKNNAKQIKIKELQPEGDAAKLTDEQLSGVTGGRIAIMAHVQKDLSLISDPSDRDSNLK